MELGATIRRLRKEARLTIDELSARTGLSRAYISQIENAKASPSLQTVRRICTEFGVSPAILFSEPDEGCVVIRANRRQVLQFETVVGTDVFTKVVHMLSEPNRKLELALIELSPGNVAADHAHPGEEIFFVLEGQITLTSGDEKHVLAAGDSVHIESSRHHRLVNNGTAKARFLSARTPPGFIDLRRDETLKLADEPARKGAFA